MGIKIGQEAAVWTEIDAVLIHPRYPMPFWPILPWGCVALAGYLGARGYRVALWDCQHDPAATDEALEDLLTRSTVRFAGLSVLSTQLPEARRLARLIRSVSRQTRIVAGGQHLSEQTLDTMPEVDFLVAGEGERAMETLLGGAIPPGDGAHVLPRMIRGQPIEDLREVPLPGRETFSRYRSFNVLTRLGLMVTRGCPFRCTFCHTAERSHRPRRYPPSWVGELLTAGHDATGLEEVFFLDDVFTLDRDWAMEVCAEIHRRGLGGLRYLCFSHVRTGSRELYRAMAQAGFVQVQIGIESGDPEIRRRMRKPCEDEEIRRAVDLIRECGMEPHGLFILGYAGESVETMHRTLRLAEDLGTSVWFSLAQPLPGTAFHQEASREGVVLETDLSKYDNRRIVYLPAGVTLAEMEHIQAAAEALRIRLGERESVRVSWGRRGLSKECSHRV